MARPSQTVHTAQSQLRRIGFPIKLDGIAGPQTRQAIKDFQRGWTGLRRFRAAHGRLTPYTRRAIAWSAANGGKLGGHTPHFTWREARSRGNGWPRVARRQAMALESYRRRVGPVYVVSWYRDPEHNRRVGGARCSRHTDACGHIGGCATDIPPRKSVAEVRSMQLFTGIGYSRSSGAVLHVDTRPGSTARPTMWTYA